MVMNGAALLACVILGRSEAQTGESHDEKALVSEMPGSGPGMTGDTAYLTSVRTRFSISLTSPSAVISEDFGFVASGRFSMAMSSLPKAPRALS